MQQYADSSFDMEMQKYYKDIPKAVFRKVWSTKVSQNMVTFEVISIICGDRIFVDCYFAVYCFQKSSFFSFPSELSISVNVTLFPFCFFSGKYLPSLSSVEIEAEK